MNRTARRIAARLLLLAFVLAAVQVVSGVSSPSNSPYLSALSDLASQGAIAAPGCNNKTCQKDPRKGPTCFGATGSNCKVSVSTGCMSSSC
jgi:hypothetical protein